MKIKSYVQRRTIPFAGLFPPTANKFPPNIFSCLNFQFNAIIDNLENCQLNVF